MLETWQHDTLKIQAEREGRSLSSLVREIIGRHLRAARRRRPGLESIARVAESATTRGEDHDADLYGK